jgi:large repetitive protein
LGGGIADDPCPNVAGEHTNTCPAGTVASPYAIRFRENEGSGCGPGRQVFRLDSGTLPPGLALSSDGTLAGTPLASGVFRFYVKMSEPKNEPESCAGKETEKQFTLPIRRPLSAIAWPTSPLSEVGVPLRMRVRARGGTGLFAWTRVAGRLPPGTRLDTYGFIEGTPRRPGSYTVTLRVRDTEKRSVTVTAVIEVAHRLVARTSRLPRAAPGQPYRAMLLAHGGVGPRRWSLIGGRLPAGIRLASKVGALVGRAKRSGTYRVTFDVRDRLSVTDAVTLKIVVLGKRR